MASLLIFTFSERKVFPLGTGNLCQLTGTKIAFYVRILCAHMDESLWCAYRQPYLVMDAWERVTSIFALVDLGMPALPKRVSYAFGLVE
jgi:hypothetical protein